MMVVATIAMLLLMGSAAACEQSDSTSGGTSSHLTKSAAVSAASQGSPRSTAEATPSTAVIQTASVESNRAASTRMVTAAEGGTAAPAPEQQVADHADQPAHPAATTAQPDADAQQVRVDIENLKTRLKKTDAIGFFTKLALRNDLMDLVDAIKRYRKKSTLPAHMKELRARFDGLLLKIITLLDDDPDLSRDLYVGRESIWKSLLEVKV